MKKEQKQTYRRIAGQNGWRKGRKRRYLRSLSLLAVLLPAAVIFGSAAVRFRPYVVLSGSMEPALQVGSVVWVDVRKTEAGIGDAVTFERDGRTVTHRIVGKTEKGYLTKGDANREADSSPVESGEVVGTVVFHLPYLGYGVLWLQRYRILLLGGGSTVLAVLFLLPEGKAWKSSRKRRKTNSSAGLQQRKKTGKRERSKTYEEKKNSGNDRSRNPVYTSDSGKYSGLSHRQR